MLVDPRSPTLFRVEEGGSKTVVQRKNLLSHKTTEEGIFWLGLKGSSRARRRVPVFLRASPLKGSVSFREGHLMWRGARPPTPYR